MSGIDNLGTAANVLGVVAGLQLPDLVESISRRFKDIQGMSREKDELISQLSTFGDLLKTLEVRASSAHINPDFLSSVAQLPLGQFKATLDDIKAKLLPTSAMTDSGKRLLWTYDKKQFENDVSKIDQYRKLAMLALADDHHALTKALESKLTTLEGSISTIHMTSSSIGSDVSQMKADLQSINQNTQDFLSHVLFANLSHAKAASYDSSGTARRGPCTKGTREAILADLFSWIVGKSKENVCWLNGMAGTGKTTIAYSLCEELDLNHILGASFFCSRTIDDCSKVGLIIPSIAYSLAQHSDSFARALSDVLKHDPDAASRSLNHQFRELLLTPLTHGGFDEKVLAVIIDALDECSDQQAIQDFLSVLFQYSANLPLRFIIVSRPEQSLRRKFKTQRSASYAKYILHDIEQHLVNADIKLYLKERLLQIAEGRSDLEDSEEDWPPEQGFEVLVRNSNNLFIYAATACQYIGGGGNIRRRLDDLTSIRSSSNVRAANIDTLYTDILDRSYAETIPEERQAIEQILGAVIAVFDPLSIQALATVLGCGSSDLTSSLASLHSVIHVPPERGARISTLHASFSDYLTDLPRSQAHFLDLGYAHRRLSLCCLQLLNSTLLRNICHLDDQTSVAEICKEDIGNHISEGMEYSCVYWISHTTSVRKDLCNDHDDLYNLLAEFFRTHVLHWFECLSSLGRLKKAVISLYQFELWISDVYPSLLVIVNDIRRFIAENYDIIHNHPLQTYSSALMWLPRQSFIRKSYVKQGSHLPKVVGGVNSIAFSLRGNLLVSGSSDTVVRLWNAATGEEEATLAGHTAAVRSVAFSDDGTIIASASSDRTVRIWNAATGETDLTLRGHSDWVNCVSISPDAKQVASASNDRTVRIWDIAGGAEIGILLGHSDAVNSVAFLESGRKIVSGSSDRTVRIWDTLTAQLECTLGRHSDAVRCVAFSEAGSRVVSGSDDCTAWIWSTSAQEVERVLEGHLASVECLSFSRDGSRVVSSGSDQTLRVWATETGDTLSILKGHYGKVTSVAYFGDNARIASGSNDRAVRLWNDLTAKEGVRDEQLEFINSVCFSGNGSHIVSASNDKTVRVWNALTGEAGIILHGHLSSVRSVASSRLGNRVASGSNDRTVRVWDASTGNVDGVLEGHASAVRCVEFSADGSRIASASADGTVRIWNVATWKTEHVLEGHSSTMRSVMFSANGRLVASGSQDCTLRVWDATTGQLEGLFEGHSSHIRCIAFSNDGCRIASGSNGRVVRVWNVATKQTEQELEGHSL